MKNNILKIGALATLYAFPVIVFAQQGKTLKEVIAIVVDYLSIGIALIISLAVVTFTWNVYRYFFKADAENKKEAGLYVMYSTIGFFVILSLWGLVNILMRSLELDNRQPDIQFGTFRSTQSQQGSGINTAPPPITGSNNIIQYNVPPPPITGSTLPRSPSLSPENI